ncbi:MAG: hypothetical protein HY831_03125 [Candidatus Aenigmarchaeota archaeon]|nr:hypothetical protein [Candidatus Aenigmarchaeota archaeon]
MKKFYFIFIILIISVVVISGCINQEEPKKEAYNFTKDGVEYTFNNNIYDSLNISIQDEKYVKASIDSAQSVIVLFNGSSLEDNSYFSVVSYNIVEKIKNYFVYSKGQIVDFKAIDIEQNHTIPGGSTVIFLRGPSTGAHGTSVYYDGNCIVNNVSIAPFNNCIVVQGTDYKNFSLAADRLILSVLDYKG